MGKIGEETHNLKMDILENMKNILADNKAESLPFVSEHYDVNVVATEDELESIESDYLTLNFGDTSYNPNFSVAQNFSLDENNEVCFDNGNSFIYAQYCSLNELTALLEVLHLSYPKSF